MAASLAGDFPPAFPSELVQVDAAALTQQFGSPLFVFSAAALRRTLRGYRATFAAMELRTRWAWSYKTNHLPAICRLFHEEDWGAEVVSAFEWRMAQRLGVPGQHVVFNGPHKPVEALREVAAAGGLVNVDQVDEIDRLAQVAEELQRPLSLGLRLDLTPGDNAWSRFGLSVANGTAWTAVERMRRFPRLKLTTLHTHLGTLIRDPQRYAEAVHRLAAFARQLRLQGLPPVETFDLGGGFASSILPLSRDEPANVPQPIEYASAIAAACREEFGVHPPQILLEAGRGLIDDCAALLTTVVAKKAGSDGREWLFVDAGVNSLPLALRQRFYVVPLCRSKDKEFVLPATSVDIFGPLCLPYDRLASDVALPSMATGDRLWFWPAGAYNVSQMTPFIEPRPAVVLLEEEGKPLLIRARDTVESLGFD